MWRLPEALHAGAAAAALRLAARRAASAAAAPPPARAAAAAGLAHNKNPFDIKLGDGGDDGDVVDEPAAVAGRAAEGAEAAKAAALRALGRRPHSRAELKQKLLDRGHAAPDVRAALDRLAAVGLQSDAEFADAFARSKWRQSHWGPAKLRGELARRGVPKPLADAALAGVFGDAGRVDVRGHLERLGDADYDAGAAVEAPLLAGARARWALSAGLAPEARRRRLAGWLARRGHGWDEARRLAEQLEREDAELGRR